MVPHISHSGFARQDRLIVGLYASYRSNGFTHDACVICDVVLGWTTRRINDPVIQHRRSRNTNIASLEANIAGKLVTASHESTDEMAWLLCGNRYFVRLKHWWFRLRECFACSHAKHFLTTCLVEESIQHDGDLHAWLRHCGHLCIVYIVYTLVTGSKRVVAYSRGWLALRPFAM